MSFIPRSRKMGTRCLICERCSCSIEKMPSKGTDISVSPGSKLRRARMPRRVDTTSVDWPATSAAKNTNSATSRPHASKNVSFQTTVGFSSSSCFFWMEWHAEEGCKGHCLLAVTPALLANSSKYLGLFGSGQTLLLLGKCAGRKLFQSERAEGADKWMMDMKTQTMTDNTDTQAMRIIAHLPRNMRRE